MSANVTVLSTTRQGGVSIEPFHSLNLGLHVGDNAEAVVENRKRLVERCALPAEPVWLNQTHSADILQVSTTHPDDRPDADGSFTCLPDTVLAVLSADCLPVVISDRQGTQLAVVHAGWRGLAAGILSRAIAAFKKDSALFAWMGPAIGPEKFEVGQEVFDVFTQRNSVNARHFKQGETQGKYWANLYELARMELSEAGCEVFGGDYCTHTQEDLFHSHRRDGTASGRIATVAWMS